MGITILHALAGLGLLIGVTLVAVVVLAKGITQGAEHNQKICDCVDCRNRRNRASDKRMAQKEPESQTFNSRVGYLSTLELVPFMYVEAKGNVYRVVELADNVAGAGISVRLVNYSTNLRTFAFIPKSRLHAKIWKPVD